GGAAFNAGGRKRRAMDLDDAFPRAPRPAVQPVDVLRDEAGKLAGTLHGNDRAMRRVRLGTPEHRIRLGRELPVVAPGALVRAEKIEGQLSRVVPGPETAGRAEIRNPRFGRDACAGKENDRLRTREHTRRFADARSGGCAFSFCIDARSVAQTHVTSL